VDRLQGRTPAAQAKGRQTTSEIKLLEMSVPRSGSNRSSGSITGANARSASEGPADDKRNQAAGNAGAAQR